MPYIALLLRHGQSMIILDLPHSCWRESHEEKAADGEHTIRAERRTRTPSSGQGGSENRQDVWHANLCVGKRQGGGEETLRSLIYHTPGLSHVCCHQLLKSFDKDLPILLLDNSGRQECFHN